MNAFEKKMISLRHPHPAFGTPLPQGEGLGASGATCFPASTPLPLGEGLGVRVRSLANLRGLGYGG